MGHIFVSYNRRDTEELQRLVDALEAAGYVLWLDCKCLEGGSRWQQQIVQAVESADAFLLVLSPHAVQSENVCRELDLAEAAKICVLPVIIAPVVIPDTMKYQLVGLLHIDLIKNYTAGIAHLMRALKNQRAKAIGANVAVATP